MFELTNEQRKCFGMEQVSESWTKVKLAPSKYDHYCTYAYLDGRSIKKVILVNECEGREQYREYSVEQTLSEDLTMILPKTAKGKAQKFSSANLVKKTPIGMSICYYHGSVSVTNLTSEKCYYNTYFDGIKVNTMENFKEWLDNWCSMTGELELADVNAFAAEKKAHQKFKEGDFFRFKLNRKYYGYGRLILDFAKMRKDSVPFWDIFMGKPLCVAVYHIVTEDADLTPEDIVGTKMLPSQMMMDNALFYGEYKVIGNMPLDDTEKNYTIHYGSGINALSRDTVHYQCGRQFITRKTEDVGKAIGETGDPLSGYRNGDIGWTLYIDLPTLKKCIEQDSNEPYWNGRWSAILKEDLRNPINANVLLEIKKQMGIL